MVYSVFKIKDGEDFLETAIEDLGNIRMALLMLEHNFIGKSGSRGYGRVKFGFANPVWLKREDYISPNGKLAESKNALDDFEKLLTIDQINWTFANS